MLTQLLFTNNTVSDITIVSLDDYNLLSTAVDVDLFDIANGGFATDDVINNSELETLIMSGDITLKDQDGAVIETLINELTGWNITAITLGDFFLNGATAFLNSGAGNYITFDSSSDDEITINIGLDRNGLEYDGSEIEVRLDWMKFGASGGTVFWELDYAFVNLGDDAYTKQDGSIQMIINAGTMNDQDLYTDSFTTISGNPGARTLQLTIRRNSAGGGSDTYTGAAEIYGVNPTKV